MVAKLVSFLAPAVKDPVVHGTLGLMVFINGIIFAFLWLAPRTIVLCDVSTRDLGTVTQAEQQCRFTIRNEGNLPVTFGEPITTCSCTRVDRPNDTLNAGDVMELVAHLRMGQKEGILNTIIRLPYESVQESGSLKLQVQGKVLPHVVAEPNAAEIDCDSDDATVIVVRSNYLPAAEVLQAFCSHSSVSVEIERAHEGTQAILLTPMAVDSVPAGPASMPAHLTIITSSEWMPQIHVPLKLRRRGAAAGAFTVSHQPK